MLCNTGSSSNLGRVSGPYYLLSGMHLHGVGICHSHDLSKAALGLTIMGAVTTGAGVMTIGEVCDHGKADIPATYSNSCQCL